MSSSLNILKFFDKYQTKLKLSFLSSETGLTREIQTSRRNNDSFEAVDYFNVIRTSSIVVVGFHESRYISRLSEYEQISLMKRLFRGPVSVIIVSHNNVLPAAMISLCEAKEIAVLKSDLPDSEIIDLSRHLLTNALAETTIEHGVYIEVYSLGVFITGNSGVGKSELALAMISRGHRLISDDVTRFARVSPDVIDGRSPGLICDFMEVRGLGVVNIRSMFGANALKLRKTLRLIVHMERLTKENSTSFDRLGNNIKTRNILGVDIPEVVLPVAPGRNLAVLVEAAARNHLLNLSGYNAAEDFIERQNRLIQDQQ
ncbi:MAG: HPr kinase/phosphorylase [Gammaproteobacteria bacterium]|jgi:HPr kinase/phosphorylase